MTITPKFTMLELYWTYQDYQGLMDSLENWLKTLIKNIGIKEVIFENKKVNFNGKWPRVKYTELIEKYSPGDMDKINTLEIDEVFKKR